MKPINVNCPCCVGHFIIDQPVSTNTDNLFKLECVHCSKILTCRLTGAGIIVMAMGTNGEIFDVIGVSSDNGLVYTQISQIYGKTFDSGVNPWVRSFNLIFDFSLEKIPCSSSSK